MLRRIPVTPLVYLAILLTTLFADGSWAAAPDESMEILLKPNPTSSSPIPDVNKAKPRDSHRTKRAAVYGPAVAYVPPPAVAYGPPPAMAYVPPPPLVCGPSPAAIFPLPPVSKIKAGWVGFPVISDCILPTPAMGQWEMEAGVIFARLRGKVTCNPNAYATGYGSGLCSLLYLPAIPCMARILISQAYWGCPCTRRLVRSALATSFDRIGHSVTRSWASRPTVAVWVIGGHTLVTI